MKYRKKPVVIDAWPWPEDGGPAGNKARAETVDVLRAAGLTTPAINTAPGSLPIKTLEGIMTASPGDWIIRGVKGEFYPCKPDVFDATYERAETIRTNHDDEQENR